MKNLHLSSSARSRRMASLAAIALVIGLGNVSAQSTTAPPAPAPTGAVPPTAVPPAETETDPAQVPMTSPPVEVWTASVEPLPNMPVGEPGVLTRLADQPFLRAPSNALEPRIFYRFQSAKGIPNGVGDRRSSKVHEVSPGVRWQLGEHWTIDYSPTWTYYSHDALDDTVDHALNIRWDTTYQAWRFDARHRYLRSHAVLVETGDQTEREHFQTTFGAALELNSRWAWQSRFGHHVRFAETQNDFREYNVEQGLVTNLSDRLMLALGAVYGFVQVDDGSDHEYIRPRLTIDWEPGDKLTLRGWVGAENRWFKNGLETTAPVSQLSADYRPFETTAITLAYNRSISPSFFQDAVSRRRSADLSITQRFLGRYYLSVRASRQVTSYSTPTGGGVIDGRRDRTTHYSARLSTPFRDRGFIALFYEPESENDSNRSIYSYSIRTFGVELGYRF